MIHNMQRIQAILSHPLFCESLHKIQELERDRIYCKHGLPHLLDVARIASLMAADRQLDLPRDVIYAAALLHDIGRLQQYLTGEDHAAAGMRTAQEILRDTAFSASEQRAILQAVSKHRRGDTAQVLGRILCEADDASRMCFACAAQDTCYWPEHRKNNTILL